MPPLPTLSPARTPPAAIAVRGPRDVGRHALETVVSEVYSRLHGARITHVLPLLVGLVEEGGVIGGVIGAAPLARTGRAFLEVYLDDPIETELGRALGTSCARESLVEVGNLAARRPGAGATLVVALAELLAALGHEWAVFTGTRALRRLFARLDVPLVDLGSADGRRLGERLADWGRYYEGDPRVTAARLSDVVRVGRASPALAPVAALATETLARQRDARRDRAPVLPAHRCAG